ncbi:MAG: nucleoside triphosphate pyrophosphohydrolase [Acidimicrobiia bacterium]
MTISIVGLGPAGLDRVPADVRDLLADPSQIVIVRTLDHPAATQLSDLRELVGCDDLYESHDQFDDVYRSIVQRVVEAGAQGDVVYAVPGSSNVGERAVPEIVAEAAATGMDTRVIPGASFLDLAFAAVGIDPIADGAQILDGRSLPDPLPFHVPTLITQVDSQLRASDVSVVLGRTLGEETYITVLDRLGDVDQVVEIITVQQLGSYQGGPRTTVFVPPATAGLFGLIATNRVLREECPWDRKQTHHSLLTHLVEEAYESADAIGRLPMEAPAGEVDFGAYAEVEDELGDLLLQIVFHATLASEAGAFDIDELAEVNRRKLVHRHPHVFGDVSVDSAEEVLKNWEQIKQEEKSRDSLMDDIPVGMPAVARAMKAQKRAASTGFDWTDAEPVFAVLDDEIAELREADGNQSEVAEELGDVLFSAINLSRHLRVDPETALRGSVERFMDRFRIVERTYRDQGLAIADASQVELEKAWDAAKRASG